MADSYIDHAGVTGSARKEKGEGPDAQSLSVAAQARAVKICRDVYAGTLRLQDAGEEYLPQFPKESDDDYQIRLKTAVLHNATKKTVKGFTGMVFRVDPVLGEAVPDEVLEHAENIDLTGRHLKVFLRDGFDDKMQTGHVGTFVDWHASADARTRGQERGIDARPYWVHIRKDQIRRFRTENRDGKIVLSRFAYEEVDAVEKGEFGEEVQRKIRQYDLVEEGNGERVMHKSWVKVGDGDWTIDDEGTLLGDRMDEIPLAVDYADRTGVLESDPPLLDLALENLRHYRILSDADDSLHTTGRAIFVATGVDPDKMEELVTDHGLALPEGADAKYVEPDGNGLSHARDALQDSEQRMAALGLAMLQRQSRAAETAKAKAIDKSESDSQLTSNANSTQDAAEEALRLHGKWLGLETDEWSIEVNTNFFAEPMSPQMATVILAWVEAGRMTEETGWRILKDGEVLPGDFDADMERELLDRVPGDQLEAAHALLRQGLARDEADAADGPADEMDAAA